jgi:hypothetical protein
MIATVASLALPLKDSRGRVTAAGKMNHSDDRNFVAVIWSSLLGRSGTMSWRIAARAAVPQSPNEEGH